VASAKEQPGDLVDNAIKTNANMAAVQLLTRSSLLKQAAAGEKVKFVTALYKLDTGAVELLTP
jgi:carbonic anhydrase